MSAPEPAPLPDDDAASSGADDHLAEDPAGDDPPPTSVSPPVRDPKRLEEVRRSVAVLGDRVLVAPPEDTERKSKGGILIPATARSIDRKGIWGEAIGVGPHVRQLGVGDDVLYLPEDAIEVDVQGEAYLIVRERDVHAVASGRRDGATGLYL